MVIVELRIAGPIVALRLLGAGHPGFHAEFAAEKAKILSEG
jgi:hypothetical protein